MGLWKKLLFLQGTIEGLQLLNDLFAEYSSDAVRREPGPEMTELHEILACLVEGVYKADAEEAARARAEYSGAESDAESDEESDEETDTRSDTEFDEEFDEESDEESDTQSDTEFDAEADAVGQDSERYWTSFGYRRITLADLGIPLTAEESRRIDRPTSKVRMLIFSRETSSKELPDYVLAIRGTVPRHWRDWLADAREGTGRLQGSGHFKDAFTALYKLIKELEAILFWDVDEAVERAVEAIKILTLKASINHYPGRAPNVVVAGHSLGAAVARSATRKLALDSEGLLQYHDVDTHLFNPPFLTVGILTRKVIPFFSSFSSFLPQEMRDFISMRANRITEDSLDPYYHRHKTDEHRVLRYNGWVPHLYVNKKDFVCNEYIKYFGSEERREVVSSTSNNVLQTVTGCKARSDHLFT